MQTHMILDIFVGDLELLKAHQWICGVCGLLGGLVR